MAEASQAQVNDQNTSAQTEVQTPVENAAPVFTGTKHKVKIDNEELEVPYEELVSNYQRKASSEKRFQQAASLKKEVDEFLGSLKSGDFSKLRSSIPQDIRTKWAEEELAEFVKYADLPQAEKDRLKAEKERDDAKRELAERDARDQQNYIATIEKQATAELDLEIAEAIKELKTSVGYDVKVTPELIENIARIMIAHLETDETASKPIPAKVATERAWRGVEDTMKFYLETIPSDKLLAMLPPKHRDAIRKADVGDAVSQMQQRIRDKQTDPEKSVSKKGQQSVSTDDFIDRIARKKGWI